MERGDAETEDVDDEDRRDAAEEIDVDDRERANREEHRPGEPPQHRDHEREDEDGDLGDNEDLTLIQNAREISGNALAEDIAVEEGLLDVGPARRVDDDEATTATKSAVETRATATLLPPPPPSAAEDLRAAVLVQLGLLQDRERPSRQPYAAEAA